MRRGAAPYADGDQWLVEARTHQSLTVLMGQRLKPGGIYIHRILSRPQWQAAPSPQHPSHTVSQSLKSDLFKRIPAPSCIPSPDPLSTPQACRRAQSPSATGSKAAGRYSSTMINVQPVYCNPVIVFCLNFVLHVVLVLPSLPLRRRDAGALCTAPVRPLRPPGMLHACAASLLGGTER